MKITKKYEGKECKFMAYNNYANHECWGIIEKVKNGIVKITYQLSDQDTGLCIGRFTTYEPVESTRIRLI